MTREESIAWLKSFLYKLETQDNRGTAGPIQFLLQIKKKYVAHNDFGYNTEKRYHHRDIENTECKTHEEAVQSLKEYGYKGEELKKEMEAIKVLKIGNYWETEQAFFTEDSIKKHISLNSYRLGEHRDYVVHAHRNPELKTLIEVIRTLVNYESSK